MLFRRALRLSCRSVGPSQSKKLQWLPKKLTLQNGYGNTRYLTAQSSTNDMGAQDSSEQPTKEKPVKIQPEEKIIGEAKAHSFKAETQKLLQIVANSLYSEKEIFCRELVSNAADALEKLRHERVVDASKLEDSLPSELEISITLDPSKKQFIIQDTGIGMTEQEMVDLLGTIARSGSKAFMEKLGEQGSSAGTKDNIIGQFGVGFYSAFMVGNRIRVYSRSAITGSKGHCWTSDGLGSYTIAEAENVPIGTKIVIDLKEDCESFCDNAYVEGMIKKYSNFVGFPIKVNGQVINTIQPLWTKEKKDINDEQHVDFYRFVANAWDKPRYKLHFKTDAPIHISTLLYVPERHTEYMGMGRMEPGVNLYSRRVLIQPKSKHLLPEYLRFVKGVVDSEDIPMNLSREILQNSQLLSKLSDVLTTKVIKWLQEEARKDPKVFTSFYNDFGNFLKEGVCMAEPKHQKELAKLLRFESSANGDDGKTSLQDYVDRKRSDQQEIFYLISPNRNWALDSPYFEPFKKKDVEVLFLYDNIDEFLVNNLHEFNGMKLRSIDTSGQIDLIKEVGSTEPVLSADDSQSLQKWFKDTLGKTVGDVEIVSRDHSFPAIITDHESPTLRKMMKMVPNASNMFIEEAPQRLEINSRHPIITGLTQAIKGDQQELAKDITQQIYDNALIAAGILDDPRSMLKRLNKILEATLVPSQSSSEKEKK